MAHKTPSLHFSLNIPTHLGKRQTLKTQSLSEIHFILFIFIYLNLYLLFIYSLMTVPFNDQGYRKKCSAF